jgi:hypothetical protein
MMSHVSFRVRYGMAALRLPQRCSSGSATDDICSEAAFRDKKMLQENGSRQGNFPRGDVNDNPIKSDIGAVAIVRNCPPLNVDYLRK